MLRRLRTYFMTGLLALAPLGITLAVILWLLGEINRLGEWLPWAKVLPVPGLGILLLLVLVTLVGALVNNFIGRSLLLFIEDLLQRMPLVRTVFDASKRIVSTVLSRDGEDGRRVVLVPYPHEGARALGILVNASAHPAGERVGVLLLHTPPTSGILLFFEREAVEPTDLTFEEAMRLLLVGGGRPSDPGAGVPRIREKGMERGRTRG